MELSDDAKTALLTTVLSLVDGGAVEIYDGVTRLVSIPLDNPEGVVTGTQLDLTVPIEAINDAGGTADSCVLTNSDDEPVGTFQVVESGSAEETAAIAAGQSYLALVTTTLIAGAITRVTALPVVMADPA